MPTPITICDDSSFARKQVARALPERWDTDITYAANGEEALACVRDGKGDILFLDLTMPIMDGYAVLETIKREDLPTVVIVISGDIQPEALARVKKLGALEFIKKPVDPGTVERVLVDYGLL